MNILLSKVAERLLGLYTLLPMINIPMAEVRNYLTSALSTIIYMRSALLFLRSGTLFFDCVSSIFQLPCCCRHCYWCWKMWKEFLLDCFLFIWIREMFCYLQPISSYIQRREIGNPRSAIPNCRAVVSFLISIWMITGRQFLPPFHISILISRLLWFLPGIHLAGLCRFITDVKLASGALIFHYIARNIVTRRV